MYKLSYSSISNWLLCPRKFKEINVEYNFRDASFATAKGTDVHKKLEEYVNGKASEYPLDYKHPLLDTLRTMYAQQKGKPYTIQTESMFAVDINGNPVGYKDDNAVLRGKIDLLITSPAEVLVVDYKTGKRRDNTLQASCYGVLTQGLAGGKPVSAVFDYLDKGRDEPIKVDKAMRDHVYDLIRDINNCREFPERPNNLCAWCAVATCPFFKRS